MRAEVGRVRDESAVKYPQIAFVLLVLSGIVVFFILKRKT